MSPDNCKIVRKAVAEAGDHLKYLLPSHQGLIKRNSYAHLWERIIAHMGKSYKDCSDDELEQILGIVKLYRDNPC